MQYARHRLSLLPAAVGGLAVSSTLAVEGAPPPASAPAATVGSFSGLWFVDVGQGSCLLVVGRDGTVVAVDAGPPGAAEAVLAALSSLGRARVDLWAVTHLDADHVGGLPRVVDGPDAAPGTADDVTPGVVWDRGERAGAWPVTGPVLAYAARLGERRLAVVDGARFETSSVVVEAIEVPSSREASSENGRGLAYCVQVDGRRILAPGDLPAAAVATALERCPDPDVLWVSHHGAPDGTSAAVVERAPSAVAVITSGHGNAHCHPAPSTIAAWRGHATWITGVAEPGRHGACGDLSAQLGPRQTVAGEGLVFADPEGSSLVVFDGSNAVTLAAW